MFNIKEYCMDANIVNFQYFLPLIPISQVLECGTRISRGNNENLILFIRVSGITELNINGITQFPNSSIKKGKL